MKIIDFPFAYKLQIQTPPQNPRQQQSDIDTKTDYTHLKEGKLLSSRKQ